MEIVLKIHILENVFMFIDSIIFLFWNSYKRDFTE